MAKTGKLAFFVLLVGRLAWSHPGPGIVVDQQGQVFFVHPIRHRIMRLDPAGKLAVFAQGEEGHKLSVPHHLCIDNQNNLYSAGDRDGVIWRIAPDGKTTAIYPTADDPGIGFFGRGGDPFVRDHDGRIFAIHSRLDAYSQILEIGLDGRLTVLAGGDYGIADGQGEQAKFANLHVGCFAFGPDASLFVTDSMEWIRKISSSGAVTTLADMSGKPRQFLGARGLACDAAGNLYVAESLKRCIYKLMTTGDVSRVAGSGARGNHDGPSQTATFLEPTGVAVDRGGAVYVLDYLGDDPCVRKVSPEGLVTTLASTFERR